MLCCPELRYRLCWRCDWRWLGFCFALCPVNLFTVNFDEPRCCSRWAFQTDAGFAFTFAFAADKGVGILDQPRRNWISTARLCSRASIQRRTQFLRFPLPLTRQSNRGVLRVAGFAQQCGNVTTTGNSSPLRVTSGSGWVAQTAGVQVEVVGIVHGGVSVLKVRSARAPGHARFGFGSWAVRPAELLAVPGIPRCCASAFRGMHGGLW